MKHFLPPNGIKFLLNRRSFLRGFRIYFSSNLSDYDNYEGSDGYLEGRDCKIFKFLGEYFLQVDLVTTDFKAINNSFYIGASDSTSGLHYNDLIYFDKDNSFVKVDPVESLDWILDSLLKPGRNIINLGSEFVFQSDDVEIPKTLPDNFKSNNSVKNILNYDNKSTLLGADLNL